MTMREQFVTTVTRLMERDDTVVLLLGDIGVHGFRECFERWPNRCHNVGVCEQAMVGLAAGLAKAGFYPIVSTIDPFLAQRALEQITIDFGYQQLAGAFVTVGASYDYAALGCTHHGYANVEIMKTIPGMTVCVPWDDIECDGLLNAAVTQKRLAYIRLAEHEGAHLMGGMLGRRPIQKGGNDVVVVCTGPLLPLILRTVTQQNVGILYYAVVAPFDDGPLRQIFFGRPRDTRRILLVEPYYRGGLVREITESLWPAPVLIRCVGVDRKFHTNYGTRQQHEDVDGLTAANIERELENLLGA